MFKSDDVELVDDWLVVLRSKENGESYNALFSSLRPSERWSIREDGFIGRSHFILSPSYILNKLIESMKENADLHSRIYNAKIALSDDPKYTESYAEDRDVDY